MHMMKAVSMYPYNSNREYCCCSLSGFLKKTHIVAKDKFKMPQLFICAVENNVDFVAACKPFEMNDSLTQTIRMCSFS